MVHVGKNIKRIRTDKNMTISDLVGEVVSRGMISLIENGKTQPSIERLLFIAKKLQVDVSELLEEIPKKELHKMITQIEEIMNLSNDESIVAAINKMTPLLQIGEENYEYGRVNELYAKAIYRLSSNSSQDYLLDWQHYAMKSIEIYSKLNFRYKAMDVWTFIIQIEYNQAQFKKTIEIIDDVLNRYTIEQYKETNSMYVKLLYMKASAYEAMGETEKALQTIDTAIAFSQSSLEFSYYYELNKAKALLLYEKNDHQQARLYMNTANTFIQSVENEELLAEHGIIYIHLEGFFEENEEIAFEVSEDFIGFMMNESKLNTSLKNEYIQFANVLKARALTKMGDYLEALKLFQTNKIMKKDNTFMSPMDEAMRLLTKSYEALCHLNLRNEGLAIELSNESVDALRKYSGSPYYRFAVNVKERVMETVKAAPFT